MSVTIEAQSLRNSEMFGALDAAALQAVAAAGAIRRLAAGTTIFAQG